MKLRTKDKALPRSKLSRFPHKAQGCKSWWYEGAGQIDVFIETTANGVWHCSINECRLISYLRRRGYKVKR